MNEIGKDDLHEMDKNNIEKAFSTCSRVSYREQKRELKHERRVTSSDILIGLLRIVNTGLKS